MEKPHDNPVTDIVVWNQSIFTPEIDELIREIDSFSSDDFDPFEGTYDLLVAAESRPSLRPDSHGRLTVLRDRLHSG